MAEERMDIFDADRRPLGYTRLRSEKLGPGEYKVVVGIWIVDARGRLLITRRSPQKRYAPGKWENTGGHMAAGETPVGAVIRELREETGLSVAEEDVRYLGTAIVPPFIGDNFIARVTDTSTLALQPGETCDARWVTLSELDAMMAAGEMAPSTQEHMRAYRAAFVREIDRLRREGAEMGDAI